MGAVKRVKNVEWEKNRRERLNLTFVELSRLLPDHDPTMAMTKLEILNKSITFIKELKEKIASVLGRKCSDVLEAEMTSLREQVDELQRRNKQLAELLQTAKISLPPRPLRHSTRLTCPRKWEGKLPPDAVSGVKNISEKKKGETKENPVKPRALLKVSTKKGIVKVQKTCKTKVYKHKETKSIKSKIVGLNGSTNPLRESNSASSDKSVPSSSQTDGKITAITHSSVKSTSVSSVHNSSITTVPFGNVSGKSPVVLSRTVTLPCTSISLVLANSKTNIVTVAKSNVLPAPIMATGIQPMLQCNPSLSSLGPGTLIMAGGRIVPVPPPPTVLTPTLILLPPTTTPVEITTTRPPHKPTSSLRPIVPKPRLRDITKTTYANKVPIPAISTHKRVLCSDAKPPKNNPDVPLDAKKNCKKKPITNNQKVIEKFSPNESDPSVSKSLSEIPKDKILESCSTKNSEIQNNKSLNSNTFIDNEVMKQKNVQERQNILKRKTLSTNENLKGPKVAKIPENQTENVVSCAVASKSGQESSCLINLKTPQDGQPVVVEELTNKELSVMHANLTTHKNTNDGNKDLTTAKSFAVVVEDTPSDTRTVSGSQNQIENVDFNKKRIHKKTDVGGNNNCVLNSSNKNSEDEVIDKQNVKTPEDQTIYLSNNQQENSQISSKIDSSTQKTGTQVLETRPCHNAESTLSEEGFSFNCGVQPISEVHIYENSDPGKEQHVLKTSHPDVNKNPKEICNMKTTQHFNENMICSINNQKAHNSCPEESQKQKSENVVSQNVHMIFENQQLSNINSTNNLPNTVVDNSTQIISLDFNAKDNNTLNHNTNNKNILPVNSDDQFSKQNTTINAIQDTQTQDLFLNVSGQEVIKENVNQTLIGDGFVTSQSNSDSNIDNSHKILNIETSNKSNSESKMVPNDSLSLVLKENHKSQLDIEVNKLENNQLTSIAVYSNETQKILSCGESRHDTQNHALPSTTFPPSNQQNSNIIILQNENKLSPSNTQFSESDGPSSNLKIRTSSANNENNLNTGNDFFNSQQTLNCSTSIHDVVPSKNPNLYTETYQFSEGIQQNTSSKCSASTLNISGIPFNLQHTNLNNHIRGVSDINVQDTNSGNFYSNGNCQQLRSIANVNVLGNKPLQNTKPANENVNFTKTLPCSGSNPISKMNVINCSSTGHTNFINPQKQNPIANNGSATNELTQKLPNTTFHSNDRSKDVTKTLNTSNSTQGSNCGINYTGSNQNQVNAPVEGSKNNNCQNSHQVSKCKENINELQSEPIKTSVSQSCKSTQVTSLQLNFIDNEKHNGEKKQLSKQPTINSSTQKKPVDELKSICDNKSLIQDDSQELTNLFPSEKLQACSENLFRDTCSDFRERNLFMPVGHSYMDEIRLNLPHSDFSNDLLSSLQVPNTGQHPESISPTAAFLLAFPLVSTSKTSELIAENEAGESQHATPTTILQIGNIEPSNSELFHHTALIMENNQNMLKENKPSNSNKDNSSKHLKDIENFNKFQQIEINELMRNENFSRNNCKEKKSFVGLSEQDVYYPCTKKKSSSKVSNYQVPSTIAPVVQDKGFVFSENNIRSSTDQDQQGNLSDKKAQSNIANVPQNIYNSSSQQYAYSNFSCGNEFMVPSSTYHSSASQPGVEKSISLASSNLNVISWCTATVTSSSTHINYTTPFCNYPQKSYSNPNLIKSQKNCQSIFDDQRIKEKSISNNNTLPKFSNFQFNNNHGNQDIHGYSQSNQIDNTNYKPESKSKKQKTSSQRQPVNWMTTPDVRPLLSDASVAPVLPDVMFQHQKDLDFTSASNNMMVLNNSNNITPFNISSSMSNNSQTLYPNSHFSGVDLQLDFTPFPEISTSKQSRNPTNVPNSQTNPHNYSWSPSKTSIPLLPHIDSHMIPSTLPTLVGDLALGTTTPSGPIDTFRNMSMPSTPFNIESPVKKFEKKHESQKPSSKSNEKDCYPNSERRNHRTIPDYCQKTHSHQSTNTSSSFLSVSQLVDQVKTEQSTPSRRATKPSGTKVNNNSQKRSTISQQMDKSKTSNTSTNQNNYHNSNPGMISQRKFDTHPGVYQDNHTNHTSGMGFAGTFPNQGSAVPWQSEKCHRATSHYKVSYSAESLIADQSTPIQGTVSDLPQFPNQYSHPPVVSSASYPPTDFSHQNVQPIEYHQAHQNCFNFPSNSHYPSGSFNSESDYHLGLDHLFNLNPTSNKHSTSSQTSSKDNRTSVKKGQHKQRREDLTLQWTPHVYPSSMRPKGSMPPHCPPATSSPNHQGTTTLTNFNLSTIFPEINDKVGMTGPPPPSHYPPAPNFRPH